MVEDDNGVIWLGTTGGGLVRYDGKNFRILDTSHGLCNNFINNLTIDSRGNLWICTGDGGLSILRKEVIKKLESGGSDQELKNYFEQYKVLENKQVQIEEFQSKEIAYQIINESIELYKQKFG